VAKRFTIEATMMATTTHGVRRYRTM